MERNDDEFDRLRIGRLSVYQTGIVFLWIAPCLFVYVIYQIMVGKVFTKSGAIVLGPGLAWGWLALEFGVGILGIVRGLKMIRG